MLQKSDTETSEKKQKSGSHQNLKNVISLPVTPSNSHTKYRHPDVCNSLFDLKLDVISKWYFFKEILRKKQ